MKYKLLGEFKYEKREYNVSRRRRRYSAAQFILTLGMFRAPFQIIAYNAQQFAKKSYVS